jgi:hypothetical protein
MVNNSKHRNCEEEKKGASLVTDLASGITNGAYIMKITNAVLNSMDELEDDSNLCFCGINFTILKN